MGVAYEGIWLRLWTFNSCGFVFLNICMISVVTCWSLELDMDIQCIILWTLCVILINGGTLIQCFSLLENCFYFTTYLKQMKCTRDSIHQLYHLTNPGSYILCPIWWPFAFWGDWAMYQIINLGLTLIGYFTVWCSHFSALLCVWSSSCYMDCMDPLCMLPLLRLIWDQVDVKAVGCWCAIQCPLPSPWYLHRGHFA